MKYILKTIFSISLFFFLGANPSIAQPDCDCAIGEENICDIGDCDDPLVCCSLIAIPVNTNIIYLVIAGGLLMMFSIIQLKPGFYKSQYSALLKTSTKIRRFF